MLWIEMWCTAMYSKLHCTVCTACKHKICTWKKYCRCAPWKVANRDLCHHKTFEICHNLFGSISRLFRMFVLLGSTVCGRFDRARLNLLNFNLLKNWGFTEWMIYHSLHFFDFKYKCWNLNLNSNTPPGAKLGLCRSTIYSKFIFEHPNFSLSIQIFLWASKFFFEHQIFHCTSWY